MMKHTVVLDAETERLVSELSGEYEQRWGAAPTLSFLLARGLNLARGRVVDTPPEFERVRVAQAQLRALKSDFDDASTRDEFFTVYGEVTNLLRRMQVLHQDVIHRRGEWKGWPDGSAACAQMIQELGELLEQVAKKLGRK